MDKELKKKLKKLSQFQNKALGHRERVKKKFWEKGSESFSDEDLLELLLFFGIPRKDTRAIARELLKKFQGKMDYVLDAPKEKLLEIPGLGPNAILPLKVVHEVAKRYLRARIENPQYLKSPKEVYEFLLYELKREKKEVFIVIYLSNDNRVLQIERLFEGTVSESVVYPREVFGRAYELGASKLILAHNHPSGNLNPSEEDKKITRLLILGGLLLNLKIIDHLILGKDSYYSFAEEGLMENIEREVRKNL